MDELCDRHLECGAALYAKVIHQVVAKQLVQVVWHLQSTKQILSSNPYASLPAKAFWKQAVASTGILELDDVWRSRWALPRDVRVAAYGSCFAQNISRALLARGIDWINCEPAPKPLSNDLIKRYNFDIFSARTGNIYTARQLLAWAQLAVSQPGQMPEPEFWSGEDGVRDSLRPAIEPRGFASTEEARESRAETVRAFRQSILTSDVMLFTMGLTEGWESSETGLPYAMCPGTIAGTFDPALHVLRHYRFDQLVRQFDSAFAIFRKINPRLKIILTISPVAPVATMSGQHILVAAMHTKSLLRAVASELVMTHADIDYFPAYEFVASPASRGMFYNPNQRTIAAPGVDFVMDHFFAGLDLTGPAIHDAGSSQAIASAAPVPSQSAADLVCEEVALEMYAHDKA